MARVLDRQALDDFVRAARDAGRRIVFTNVLFDILHPGNLR